MCGRCSIPTGLIFQYGNCGEGCGREGVVVVVPYWTSRTTEKFYELLEEEQVTVLDQTASAFRQ